MDIKVTFFVVGFVSAVMLVTAMVTQRTKTKSALGPALIIISSWLLVLVIPVQVFPPVANYANPHSPVTRIIGVFMAGLGGQLWRMYGKRARVSFANWLMRVAEEMTADAPMSNPYLRWSVRWFVLSWTVSTLFLII
jgi:hypothetical protein